MTEEFLTLETAKLLKEKGFNEYCKYVINDKGLMMETIFRTSKDLPKAFYSRPMQSIAQKWLRETKNMHICIYNTASGYSYEISKADNGTSIFLLPKGPNDGGKWDTYEEALEAGLQKALKLI